MAEPRTVRENANTLSSVQIAEILPHRYPFALVDRILDYELLEALAQTGAVAALSLPENKGKLALFGGIKSARFRKQVTPGDVLTLHCELVQQHGAVGVGKASAWVDGKCAVTAELTFVLTDAAE